MNTLTHPALLPLPELPRRPSPALHYNMPHSRHFAAAFVLSAAVHAGFICGFNTHPFIPTPPRELVWTPPPGPAPTEVDLTPPPPVLPDRPPEATETKARAPVDPVASIRETFAEVNPGGIRIVLAHIDAGTPPDLGRNVEKVPLASEFGRRTPTGEEVVPLDKLDKRPEVVHAVDPRYPIELLHNGLGGTVVVRFIVTRNGDVGEVTVLTASHPDLAAAAVEAVRKWKFHAGRKNNRCVDTCLEMPLNFAVTEDL